MGCCCFGYFIYDTIDLIKNIGVVQAYDILIHHAIVFGKFKKNQLEKVHENDVRSL
jgi:hypothetical protein